MSLDDKQMQSSVLNDLARALFNANYPRFINVHVCIVPANDEQFRQNDF